LRRRTRDIATREAWVDAVEEGLAALLAEAKASRRRLHGVGVGVPGFVDFARGHIHQLTNVEGWEDVPLADVLGQRLQTRVRVDNDVNAMALGECTFGAGRDYDHAVFVTLGTGVGGALLIDGSLYRGAYSMAGEIGHMSINARGRRSPEGRGGLELYVGNRALVGRAVRQIKAGRRSAIRELVGGDLDQVSPKTIARAASAGDGLGREIFDYAADCLACTFASVTYLLQPQVFIVGGGVAYSGAVLFDPLRQRLAERLSPYFASRIEVCPATLGNRAGMIGSAALALA
jgi:glucokinase